MAKAVPAFARFIAWQPAPPRTISFLVNILERAELIFVMIRRCDFRLIAPQIREDSYTVSSNGRS